MANNLMFEVGVEMAKEQFEAIKGKIEKYNKEWQKDLQIKVEIENLESLTKALSQIGDTSSLRNLRAEIAALNKEFLQLSKGAGGTGSIADRGLAQDIERQSQNIERYTAKIKELTEERSKLVGGVRNVNYEPVNSEIEKYTLMLDGANKKLKELQEQGSKPVVSSSNNTVSSFSAEGNAAQEAIEKLNKLVTEKQQVVDAERKLAESSKTGGQTLKEEADNADKTAQSIKGVGKAQKDAADASKKAEKEQEGTVDNLTIKYQTLIARIENWQSILSKLLAGGDSKYFGAQLNDAIEAYQKLKEAALSSGGSKEEFNQLRSVMTWLGQSYANVNKEAKEFNKTSEQAEKAQQKAAEKAAAIQQKFEAELQKRYSNLGIRQNDPGLQNIQTAMDSLMQKLGGVREYITQLQQAAANGSKEGIQYLQESMKLAETEANSLMRQYIALAETMDRLSAGGKERSLLSTEQSNKELQMLNEAFRTGTSEMQKQAKAESQSIKELSNAAKQAEKDNKLWADSIDNAKKKYAELKAKIQEIESVEKKLSGRGIDTTALQQSIEQLRQNLSILLQMVAGAKIYGTSQSFTSSSQYQIPIIQANSAAKQLNASVTSQLSAEEQKLAQAISHSSQQMRGQSQVMSDLKMMATQYLGVWGAQGFLKNVIEIGGQLEMQRLSIGAILGDMAKASELFDRIKNLAIKSPFGVVELDQMTKQLSAYGFEYGELFDMTKRLADISAATGTSVDRLALALGHVRSEAALSGYTLRQFSMANIPLAKKLSEELTRVEGKLVSVADVRKRVRKKEISYEDVLKVLKDLTDEGGMFYNAQEIMAESVKAKYKNLKDSMDIMYNEIAESKVGAGLKNVAALLTTLTRHWQELGAVIIAGAGYWAINRVAMMASNKIMIQANLITGRFSAAQLEMQATTGNLTRAQLLQAVATKKLAVADAEAAGAVLGLSRAQLQHVANTGKTSAALNIATLATSKYTISQLRLLATMRSMNLGWLANGWLLLTNGIKAAGVAALGFMKATWPMFAISAVVEVFMSMKREAEQFADAANYVGQSARNMMKDIDDAMKTINKNGKPLDEEGLRNAVNSMKEILEQSEFYTAEQQKQVDKATTLSGKYDVLLKQMKEMREEAEWHANNEGLIETILKNTGRKVVTNDSESYNPQTGKYEKKERLGSNFFNNSLQENIEQVNKSNSKLQSAIQLLSEYQGVMNEAIKKNNNFGLSLEGKSWQEQIKMIAQSGHWDEFVASVENAGSRFDSTAANVKKASDKVVEDWQSIVGDDVKAIRLTLMQEWGMTEDDLNQFAKNNEKTMRWLVDSIAKSLSKLGVAEAIIDEFKQKLLELFGVANSGKPTKREPTEYEKQTDLGKHLMRNVLNYNKNNGKGGNGVTTVKEINDITGTGENQKTVVEVTKTLKERAQKSLENMKETKKIYGEASKEYKDAKKKFDHDLNIAQSNGITEAEIRSGKYNNKSGSKTDENAKAVREEMRIMKEAADAFQYWREKVGDAAAWAHVEEEFGDVLARIGVTAKNVNDLRGNIEGLTPKIKKIKDKKVQDETYKEQAKELAQLSRKDFEKTTEEFASKVQIELDGLTRAWEIFNNVREATGNVELAVQISGADYAGGKTRNIADALREKIQKDFDAAGGGIAFDMNLSDKDIEESIKKSMPSASQEQIKGLVDEYKKWRDLQRDVLKSDIDMFAKLVGGAKDYESQLQIIDDKLRNQKEATDNLVKEGKISRSQANKANAVAQSERDEEAWKISLEYANLMNNSLSLTRQEVENGINRAYDIMNQKLEAGRMTAKEYADEIAKIRNIQSEWNKNSFFGINNAWAAGMMGGLSGRRSYYQNDLNKAMTSIAFYEGKIRKGTASDDDIINLNRLRKKAEKDNDKIEGIDSLENLINSFDALSKSLEPVIDLFDKLGMEDVGQVLGMGQKALQSASSMGMSASMLFGQAAGPYGAAIGAGLSLMSSIVSMHDEALQKEIEASKQRQKKMGNMSKNLDTALDRALGGIFNVGNTAQGQYAMESFTKQFKQYQDIYNERLRLEKELEEVKNQKPASSLLTGSANKSELDAWERKVLILQYLLRNASYVKDDTYEYIKKAEETQKYYDMQRASLVIQRDELEKQIAAERDKKDSDSGAISDMEQQVKEIEDQLFNFAKDMAKALYDIDVKSWAQQLGDALYDAWKQGEDGAEAFRKKAKEIIGSIAKNIIVQRVIEKSLEPVEKAIVDMMDKTSGELDKKNFTETIGSMLTESIGTIVPTVEAALDAVDAGLQKQGLSSLKDNSSSVSGSIKSITENTADLLASYLNAIRADVSVNRIELVNIRENYLKDIKAQMISASASLQNIENHTAAIMRSNDVIADKITHLDDNFNALRNRVWSLPVS